MFKIKCHRKKGLKLFDSGMSQITTDMFHLSQTHPSYLITGFVTQWVSLVEQELLALPGHQSSPPVLCVFCPFPSVHCVVCPSIYEF